MRPSCRAFWLKKKNKLPSPVESEDVANVTQIFGRK